MSGLGNALALDINTPVYNPASPLAAAQQYTANQTANSQAQVDLGASKEKAGLLDIGFRNAQIANAASHGLDSDSWDDAMRAAVKNGAPEAAQFIGRYTPVLQQRLLGAYGEQPQGPAGGQSGLAAGPGGGTTAAQAAGPTMDRQFANMTPDQMAASLKRLTMISNAVGSAKDPASWDAAARSLVAAGIPGAANYIGQFSPLNAQRIWNSIQPQLAYLQQRVTSASAGLPAPLVPQQIEKTENTLFAVDPYGSGGATARVIGQGMPTRPAYEPGDAAPAGNPTRFNKFTGRWEAAPMGNAPDPAVATGSQTGPQPPVAVNDFASQMNAVENSTGNPAAKNPNSTATGNGQFINSTWISTVKSAAPDIAKGKTDAQILAMRADPDFSQQMTAALAKKNAASLDAAGEPVTTTTLALAHRFGADDTQKLLSAAPNDKMSDVLSPAVIKANPDLKNQTVGQYVHGLVGQVGTAPVDYGQGGITDRPMTPFEKELQTKILPEQFEAAKTSYDSAQNLKLQLSQMQDQLAQMGTSGFMAPGTGATERAAFAKRLNSMASMANLPPIFDPNKVASSEDIMKGTTRLGFDLARQLGSREAMMIVQQAVGAVPGIENTPRGAKLVFGSLNSAAQRQSDYYEYLQRWAQSHPSTLGADVAFNKAFPVSGYTTQALLAGVPPTRIAFLKANPKGADKNGSYASQFDDYYGNGLSKVVLGAK